MKNKFIDLHLHLDGSLSVASVRHLAAMQQMELPDSDEALTALLQVNKDCKSLTEYLKCFDFALSFLQTKEAIEESVATLLDECRQLDMQYVEVRFAPQLHLKNGLTQREVIQAAVKGQHRSTLPSGLILCCMRGENNHEQNMETIKLAAEFMDQGVCAVDIAGDEAHFPLENYTEEFALAKRLGVPFTIHAGEADGPESVWKALFFGATRIGHGVRSVEDPELLAELARRGTVLELCPTSNLNTCIFERIEDYPLRELLDTGVKVTINSDNMTVSATNVRKELELMKTVFALTEAEIQQLKQTAAEAVF